MENILPVLIPVPFITVGLGNTNGPEKSMAAVSLVIPDQYLELISERIVKPHARPENFFIGHTDNGDGTFEIMAYCIIDLDHWVDIPGTPQPQQCKDVIYRYVIGNEVDIEATFFQAFNQRRLEQGYFIVSFSPVDESQHAEYLTAVTDGWFMQVQAFHGPEIYKIMNERLGL